MICLPWIRDELCRMLEDLTYWSEMESSLSKKALANPRSQVSAGTWWFGSKDQHITP